MKTKIILKDIFIVVLVLLALGFLLNRHCSLIKGGASAKAQGTYFCPMHPSFTSEKPGACMVCGMELVKKKTSHQEAATPSQTSGLAPEKTLSEVCIEHNCTMKNCTMHVRANLKPGERIICPICGEVISTATGKVVEVAQPVKAAPAATTRKLLYYRNPMNPEVTSPTPMKDSMGMDYVPVYASAAGAGAQGVYISQEKQQLIGVKTEAVAKRHMTKIIRAFSKVAYDPDLYVAQEEYLQALKTVNATKNSVLASVTQQSDELLKAAEKKLQLLGMSPAEIEQLAQQGAAQENLYLPAGQNSIWVYVSVYEYEIGLVKIGSAVGIESVAYPGEVFKGKVVSINPVLDPATRTNQVRVEIENPEGKLKPEMFANAQIDVDLGDKLAVPESAVLDTGIRRIVYLSLPGDILESREVTLGQKAEGYYEVLSGLNEGDIVVTSGNFLVDSESKLKAAQK